MAKKKQISEDIIEEDNKIDELDEEIDEDDLELDDEVKTDNDDEEEIVSKDLTLKDHVIEIEKKINIILVLVLIIFLLNIILIFGIFNNSNKQNNNENQNISNYSTDTSNYNYDTSAMKEISATDISSESKKETIIVVIGRQGCSACASFIPILTEVAKEYNTTVRYIDLAKIVQFTSTVNYITDDEAYDTLISLTGNKGWETFVKDNLGRTPLTIVVKNNKVTGGIGGTNVPTNTSDIEKALDAAGLKK